MTKSEGKSKDRKYQPPVAIPLDFDRAVEGLLAVKPEPKPAEKKAKAKRKK